MYKSTLDGSTPINLFKTYDGILAFSIGSKEYLRTSFTKITLLAESFLTMLCVILMWFGIYKVIVYNKEIENLIDG